MRRLYPELFPSAILRSDVAGGRVTQVLRGFDGIDRSAYATVSRADALVRMVEAEETLRAISEGQVDAFVVSDGDTDRRVFSLSTADRPYRRFVESMRDGAATLSSDGIVLYANRRLVELLACPGSSIVGSSLSRFVAGGLPSVLREAGAPGSVGDALELDLVDGRGELVPVRVGFSPLEMDGDRLTCLTFADLRAQRAQEHEIARLGAVQLERMVDLQHAQAALTQQATHDALTGLPNRALLVDRIDQALLQARRTRRYTAVLFVDLDRFKHINDTQGHAAGDLELRRVAERLVDLLRPMDTVSRIGGDEFVVLAPDVDSRMHAVDMSTRLVRALGLPDELGGEAIPASVGVAISVSGRGSAEILLDEADKAMYHAKSRGGGSSEVFDVALGRKVKKRIASQKMLQSALDERRVILYYQPLVELATGRVAGFEALARIAALDGSVVAPSEFIPVAEDSGLVVPLCAQVLALACDEARDWSTSKLTKDALSVAVNLSAHQFGTGDLPAVVRRELARTGVEPACLHLELTETAIIDLRPDILQQLVEIRDMNVEIGLDDFGTGYASLTHLRRLPITFVKIDQSFVQGLGTDEEDERIVSSVVDLAGNLGLRSIAEGVETADQLARLREIGADQAQGYLFARPLPHTDVASLVGHAPW